MWTRQPKTTTWMLAHGGPERDPTEIPLGSFMRQWQALTLSPDILHTCTSPRLLQETGCTAPQRIRPYLGKEKTELMNPPAPTWFVPNSWNVVFPMENNAIKITNNNNINNNKITIGLFSKQTNTLLTYRNVFFFWKTLSASLKKNSQRCPGRTWFCVANTVERPKMNSERNITLWNGLERRQVSE